MVSALFRLFLGGSGFFWLYSRRLFIYKSRIDSTYSLSRGWWLLSLIASTPTRPTVRRISKSLLVLFFYFFSDFTSKETMHTLIEKFYPSFDRGISNLTSASQCDHFVCLYLKIWRVGFLLFPSPIPFLEFCKFCKFRF
jgi:hypothetical protein